MVNTDSITSKLTNELELLERHLLMLKITKKNQPIGIIRLSELLEMPKHKVRYSLRLLEEAGLIQATSGGAMVTDGYDRFLKEISSYLDNAVGSIRTMKETADDVNI